MLLAICALEVWRLTGVPLHEILGIALALAVLAHLLLQRRWVAANVRRPRLNFVLNLLLFLAFTAATVSGVMISKFTLPRGAAVTEYLKWHSIHDVSSKLLMLLTGLHVAMNWAPLVVSANAFVQRSGRNLAYAAAIAAAVLAVSGALVEVEKVIPATRSVTLITPDGKRREVPPPPEMTHLRPDQRAPRAAALPPFAMALGIVSVAAVAGRKLLRLRL